MAPELRLPVALQSADELPRLAASGVHCSALVLPAPPVDAAVTLERAALAGAAADLLASAAFRGASAGSLEALANCPFEVARSGGLAGFGALHHLGL